VTAPSGPGFLIFRVLKGKGKPIPLQALTYPESSRKLGLPDLNTIGTWRWQDCQPHAPAAFTHRKCFWYSFLLEAESTSGPITIRNSSDTIGNRTRDFSPCSAVPQPLRHRVYYVCIYMYVLRVYVSVCKFVCVCVCVYTHRHRVTPQFTSPKFSVICIYYCYPYFTQFAHFIVHET
jgi:hypothetical protein